MSERYETLAARIQERFGEQLTRIASNCGELAFEVDKDDLVSVATALRNEGDFGFEMLMDAPREPKFAHRDRPANSAKAYSVRPSCGSRRRPAYRSMV